MSKGTWMWVAMCVAGVCGLHSVTLGQGLVEYGSGGQFQTISVGSGFAVPLGVSNDGRVVGDVGGMGGAWMSYGGSSTPLWGPSYGPVDLGTMSASGISADGNIISGAGWANTGSMPVEHALSWNVDTGECIDLHESVMVPAGALGGPDDRSVAFGVSPDGSTIVGQLYGSWMSAPAAYYIQNGTLEMPVVSSSFDETTELISASDNGQYLAGTAMGMSGTEAFRYERDTQDVIPLGNLAGGGMMGSWAQDISADGEVIIGSADSAGNPGYSEAFAWSEADGMFGLGVLGGMNASRGWSVGEFNGQKIAVGDSGPGGMFYFEPTVDDRAFIWIEDDGIGGMMHLQSFLETTYGYDFGDWTLNGATTISPNGRFIAGVATDSMGGRAGYVIDMVPEPATMSLLAVGALAVVRRRRK